jgi:pyrroline-5-carboxylate reductase
MRVSFIGGGTMGEAIVKCLLDKNIAVPGDIIVSDVSESRRELLRGEYRVNTLADNRKAMEDSAIAVLAVKPQDLNKVMEEIKNPPSEQVVLSIVAGASLACLRQGLNHPYLVRAMPNMPAQIAWGMTVWTATTEVDQKQKKLAQTILSALGEEIYLPDEKYIDMATALSGSGPAYIFLIIEALIDAGVHIGLSRDIAQKLVIQTVLGSTYVVQKTGKHPAELRNMVTSPGGTTAEALLKLEEGGLRGFFLEAVAAAYDKAKQL